MKTLGQRWKQTPTINTNFCQCIRHNVPSSVALLSRYFPESVSYRAMGRSILVSSLYTLADFDGMTRGGETGAWLCIMRLSLGQAKLGTVLPVSITYFW